MVFVKLEAVLIRIWSSISQTKKEFQRIVSFLKLIFCFSGENYFIQGSQFNFREGLIDVVTPIFVFRFVMLFEELEIRFQNVV